MELDYPLNTGLTPLCRFVFGVARNEVNPRYAVIDYEPCEKCKKNMSLGFTVMEATTAPNSVTSMEIQTGVYPTGRFVVIKREAATRIFGNTDTDKGKAFLESPVFTQMFCRTE